MHFFLCALGCIFGEYYSCDLCYFTLFYTLLVFLLLHFVLCPMLLNFTLTFGSIFKLGSSTSKYFAGSLLAIMEGTEDKIHTHNKVASTWSSSSVHTSFHQSSTGSSVCNSYTFS